MGKQQESSAPARPAFDPPFSTLSDFLGLGGAQGRHLGGHPKQPRSQQAITYLLLYAPRTSIPIFR